MLEPLQCIDRADGSGWLFFVFEIGENLALGRPPAQSALNDVELHCGVSALTETVAREWSGHYIRSLQIFTLGDTKRDCMMPQHGIHIVAKPCAVPKFESHPQPTRIRILKEGVEARSVGLEIGRKLEQHHTHPSGSQDRRERARQGSDCF
jgi:hypothetical protein